MENLSLETIGMYVILAVVIALQIASWVRTGNINSKLDMQEIQKMLFEYQRNFDTLMQTLGVQDMDEALKEISILIGNSPTPEEEEENSIATNKIDIAALAEFVRQQNKSK